MTRISHSIPTKSSKKKVNHRVHRSLPVIPDKRYFTIGEVSYLCGVQPHVLRYWEQEFSQLKPVKRRGNRRYYQYRDVLLARKIRQLLYAEGYTIEGARAHVTGSADKRVQAVQLNAVVKKVIVDLEGLLESMKKEDRCESTV